MQTLILVLCEDNLVQVNYISIEHSLVAGGAPCINKTSTHTSSGRGNTRGLVPTISKADPLFKIRSTTLSICLQNEHNQHIQRTIMRQAFFA